MPWLLAGGALVAVPWLVHRIRRPQHRQLRFSSLMFVPTETAPVVEPQNLQHWLLMLVRMALLMALALAFARPFWPLPTAAAAALDAPGGAVHHLIVLDLSASMGRPGFMRQARQQIEELLLKVGPKDRVGLVTFGRHGRVVVPLGAPADGAVEVVRRAVAAARPTWEGTRYGAGLQVAEQMLLAAAAGQQVLHLVSDLQAVGLPRGAAWRLDRRVQLEPWAVEGESRVNCAVQTVAVQAAGPDRLQIKARVKNWSDQAVPGLAVRLVAGDGVAAQYQVDLPPGSATLVQAAIDRGGDELSGYVEIGGDDWPVDDRRYFIWNAPVPLRLGAIAGGTAGAWPYERLVATGLPAVGQTPWRLDKIPRSALSEYLQSRPGAVVLDGWDGLSAGSAAALRRYWLEGGRLLVLLGRRPGAAADPLWGPDGPVYLGIRPFGGQAWDFARWAWVDLEHPVFRVFRGARFNDFSGLHFSAYHRFQVAPDQEGVAVLARFEGAGDPAVMEVAAGSGRMIVWSAGIEPEWSNMARSARFVPLLQETLRYLIVQPERPSAFLLGAVEGPLAGVERPGLYPVEGDGGRWTAAVNGDPAESDPAVLSGRELALRLGGLAALEAEETAGGGDGPQRREAGRFALALALCLLLVESYCAGRRARPAGGSLGYGSA